MIMPFDLMERACPICGLGWGFHDYVTHAMAVVIPEKLLITKD